MGVWPCLAGDHSRSSARAGRRIQEDFYSGTQAALAGGVTTVLAMPDTTPPITDRLALEATLGLAAKKAVCDYGLYLGATRDNVTTASTPSRRRRAKAGHGARH